MRVAQLLTRVLIRLGVGLALATFLILRSFAQGVLDSKLEQMMTAETGPFEVIVTFKSQSDANSLSSLGVSFLALRTLPMAGAILTQEQINTVLSWESVESIYFNDRLEYSNWVAGEVTGAHFVQATYGAKGKGTTIVVLDSGIDAAHPDLAFRAKVVENVKIVSDLGITGTTAFIEGVLNTDNTSGHGTHVAGTAGGTGAASADDERDANFYRGVAPEANIVGIGAGETLFILSALVGFDYAIATKGRFGTSLITNSWGNSRSSYDPNNPISKASYEAYRRGIVVTFAAGNGGPNDNTMSTYAINPWVIGVAAGSKAKDLAGFSSRGEAGDAFEHPDVTAPGVDISSTRAIGTPIGALGPVVDPNHPSYYAYYHTISGTSMATPFVAGTVALLLGANPNLSPDQIEEIITETADPMPPYQLHQVGKGYINVRKAFERALTTTGDRQQFLAGDTKWSSQGTWLMVEESNSNLGYSGSWQTVSNPNASGGVYKVAAVRGRGSRSGQLLNVSFFGTNVKLGYPTDSKGGTAEILIDGVSRGKVSYYSDNAQWGIRSAFGGLSNADHTLQLRALNGSVYVDNVYVDGQVFPSNTEFVEQTTTYTGTMGPSALGVPETRSIPFEVGASTIYLSAELGWSGGVDIDLYLLDPDGNEIASSASLDNPERLTHWVSKSGTYTYELIGFATVVANYTLTSTQTKAVTSQSAATISGSELPSASKLQPKDLVLFQNYPNPFNPQTKITYQLPFDGFVTVKVFNILGVELAELVRGEQTAGVHSVSFNGKNLPSGIYFYKVEVGEASGRHASKINRMALIK